MDLLKHIETVAKTRHPKWRVQLCETGMWMEGESHKVRTPAREYAVGWGCLIGLASDGEWRIQKERRWVEPAYGKDDGVDWCDPSALPERLKRTGVDGVCTAAMRSLRKEAEFEVVLPNEWLARWDAFRNKVSAWGEIPKKDNEKRLKRPQISWEDFLKEQEKRGGQKDRLLWEKSLEALTKSRPEKPSPGMRVQ